MSALQLSGPSDGPCASLQATARWVVHDLYGRPIWMAQIETLYGQNEGRQTFRYRTGNCSTGYPGS